MSKVKFKMELDGFDALDKALKKLPDRIENKVLQKSVNKALRVALKDVKAAAPRDTGDKSPSSEKYGPLWKNLKVKKYRKTKKNQKGARMETGNAFWAIFYELGTARQPARPFFGPAFRKAADKVLKTLRVELGKNIEKEAKKLGKGL